MDAVTIIAQFLPMLLWYALLVFPTYKIMRRVGKSRWWVIVLLIPIFGFVIVQWIVAFSRWKPGTPQIAAVFD
jgi:hypothetical protein